MEKFFKGMPGEMFSSLLINNPDPIFLLDENGKVLDVNAAATDFFGYSASEFADVSYLELIDSDYMDEAARSFTKTLQGEISSYAVSVYSKDGKLLHTHVKNLPLFNHPQQLALIVVVIKDVTDLVETKAELQKTSEKLMSIYESSADAMDIIDLEGNVVQVNKAFEEMYGWKAEEIIGKPMPTIPADRMDKVKEERQQVLNHHTFKGLEVECLKKDGSTILVNITQSPLHDEHSNVIAFSGISRDISERKRIEEELIRSEEKYRLIAENMTDIVTLLDKNGVITYASPSTTHILGFPLESYVGSSAFTIVHPDDLPTVRKHFYSIFQKKSSHEMEFRYKHKTKEWIWLEAKGTYFTDETKGEGHLLVVSRVIEEKKLMREKLKQMAFHDELTGLPNRRLFQEIMRQKLKEAKRNKSKSSLLFMDIDKFKWVNDHLGHSIGDELLKLFSERVKQALRESDVFARQSGDEFLVLLPDTDKDEAIRIVERILDSLQEEWRIRGNAFATTSSIGVAMYPEDGTTMETLIANADHALYKAKENGRNTYIAYSNLN